MKGLGNQQDYGERISDTRLGRFLSVDPIAREYPNLVPYQFASNRPLDGIDLDGLEWAPPMMTDPKTGKTVIDAAAAAEQQTALYKWGSAKIFKSVFTHDLPKKFIDHYVWGKGKPYWLTPSELEQLHVTPLGMHGGTENDIRKFEEFLGRLSPGESMDLPGSYSIRGGANNGGTLGRFTIKLEGTVTKDRDDPRKWSFKGRMQFYDIYDFETSPTPSGDLERTSWGDFQTDFGRKFLRGKGFQITSDWIPVEQKGTDYFDWFAGKDFEPIQNEISTHPKRANEVKKTAKETKE